MRIRSLFTVVVGSSLAALAPTSGAQGFAPCTRTLYVLEGESPGDSYGWVSSPLADATGDGVSELGVGAPFRTGAAGASAGRVYVHDGRTGVELAHLDGGAAGELLGWSVRDCGDLDGDGIDDLIAGGPGNATTAGVARVVSSVTGDELLTIQLGAPGELFGFSVTGIGDVDGDLVPDLAVGATQDDTAAADAGRVVVVSGADGTSVLRTFLGEAAGDHFGSALARLRDVTGDGAPELIVGAADSGATRGGRAYVFDVAAGMPLHTLLPDVSAQQFGQFFVADVGRIDADLVPDVYVGDFADQNGRGKAYVFSGASGARLLTLAGQSGSGFGIGRSLGDVNGDGRDDLVIGAYTVSSQAPLAGRADVYSGIDGSRLRRVTSRTANEGFGFDAHGLGDVDGDGVPEMVVTAANYASSRGRVYLIADAPLEPFGAGVAGSGAFVPTLALTGCPTVGGGIAFGTAGVLGGAMGVLVVGTSRIDLAIAGGVVCPAPSFVRVWHVASGTAGVAGAGTASLAFTLPNDPLLVGMKFYSQAIYADPGGPSGFAFTAGLRVTVY